MPNSPDPEQTFDQTPVPSDSLGPGLAAAFGQPTEAPRSSFGGGLKPVMLPDAAGESSHIVKTQSDALPKPAQAGDRYQLSGEIARGGMGAVLRGRDVDLGRDLAIKVLLEKHAQRPEVARRFLEEAQIGGQLQHPGVVPVYDIGRFGERPFFTMKLVKGKTLAEVLAERKDPSSDRPRLLGIALRVSQTLAYAHAKGVIHRDLKPANIMVGSFGEVQVMDWGLAKVLASGGIADEEKASRLHQEAKDETHIKTARSAGSTGSFGTDTEAGSLLGTPAYMPPEQANGDVALMDRRADVFGLGAILCEILTGKPPYVGRSQEEVRRKAANGDLADAYSRLAESGADKELVTLTRLCLSPEPMDRPKDAQAVAESLSGYLDGVQERLRTAERERAVAVVRVAEENKRRRVQLALAGAVTLLLLGAGSFAWWRSEQAQVARERDARNGEAVSALLAQTEEALKQGDAAKANVALDAAKKRSAEGGAENEEKRLKRLDGDLELLLALDAIDQFRWTWTENQFPGWKESTIRLGETLKRFGLDPEVNPVSELAVWVNKSLLRERLIAALDKVMFLKSSAKTRALLEQVDSDGYRDALRDAFVKADTAKIIAIVKKKEAMEQPHWFIAFLGEFDGVPRERKRQLLEAAVARQPGNLGLLMQLGLICSAGPNKSVDERLCWYQAAVATAPENYAAHINLGVALGEKGQIDESIACYQRANTINPNNATGFHNLGVKLTEKGQWDEAITCFRKAIANNPGQANSYGSLADALKEKGQWDSAIESFRNSIAINPNNANIQNSLGAVLKEKGRLEEAMHCFRTAIALNPNEDKAHNNLGACFVEKNQLDEAISSIQKAIEINPKPRNYYRNLGLAFLKKGDPDQAITSFRKIIEIDPLDADAHLSLGNALKSKGQLNEAIASYQNAINFDPKKPATISNYQLPK